MGILLIFNMYNIKGIYIDGKMSENTGILDVVKR